MTASHAPAGRAVEVRTGPRAVQEVADGLDDLVRATGGPLTARSTWLQAWAVAHPNFEPWVIVVRDGDSGALDAAAVLCRRELAGRIDVAPLGFGRNDRSRLPARDAAAAALLAERVAAELSALGRSWTLRVEQLPTGDPVASGLAAGLPWSALVRGGDVPHVRFEREQESSVDAYLTKNQRRALRKAQNRLAADGHHLVIDRQSGPDEVRRLLPEVAAVHRERDHAQGRPSDLDTAEGERFWWEVLDAHAERGEVEVTTMRSGADLVAYVVGFLDAPAYRVFDGRCSNDWTRYSPGRLVETATIAHALDCDRFAMVDWMNSVAPDKLVAANGVEHTEHFVACSPSLARVAVGAEGSIVDLRSGPTADTALLALAGVGRDVARRAEVGAAGR